MARSTTEKRRLIKFSNYSMCVTLPKWVIDQLHWEKGDVLTLSSDIKQGKITLFKDTKEASKQTTPKSVAIQSLKPSQDTDLKQVSEITDDGVTEKLRW